MNEKNEGLRFISKLLLNSFWGYLGMKENLPKTKYVNKYSDIVKAFTSPKTIVTDLTLVGEDIAVMQYQTTNEFLQPSTKTNVILAAFTTSHARTILYHYLDMIDDPQRICYCDTDSIMYYTDSPLQNSIPTGNYLGDMTDELPKNVVCKYFYCAGPKFYLLSGENKSTGEEFSIFKVKGLTLNHGTADKINAEQIKSLCWEK